MKNAILFTCWLAITTVLVSSCVKTPFSASHQGTLKGRILQDCSGAPLANYPLSFYQVSDLVGNTGGVRGTATTDANGNFTVHLSNLNGRSLEVERESSDPNHGPLILTELSVTNCSNGETYDCGNIYLIGTVNYTIKVHLARTFTANDTLFVGEDYNFYKAIYPITEGSVLSFARTASSVGSGINSSTNTINAYWDIGHDNYASTYEYSSHTSGQPRNQIKAKATICIQPDTTFVTIQ